MVMGFGIDKMKFNFMKRSGSDPSVFLRGVFRRFRFVFYKKYLMFYL